MKTRLTAAVVVGIAFAAFVFAQKTGMDIVWNGKSVPGKVLVSNGATYVPTSAIKAAGGTVSVQNGKLVVSFAAPGGANQISALEGGIGDWLFNGIWRFRVASLKPLEGDRPGWSVGVELRNGTKLDNVALAGSGVDSIKLVFADGNALEPYNVTELRDRGLGQGASAVVDLVFYDDEGRGRKPDKLIIRIAPDSTTVAFLKNQGATYSVSDPSFRVRLGSDR